MKGATRIANFADEMGYLGAFSPPHVNVAAHFARLSRPRLDRHHCLHAADHSALRLVVVVPTDRNRLRLSLGLKVRSTSVAYQPTIDVCYSVSALNSWVDFLVDQDRTGWQSVLLWWNNGMV